MTSDQEKGVLIVAFLILWFWQRGHGDVTLKETCTFPDGSSVLVPLGRPCPFDAAHGGQSNILEEK